jgi:hypothetical protein
MAFGTPYVGPNVRGWSPKWAPEPGSQAKVSSPWFPRQIWIPDHNTRTQNWRYGSQRPAELCQEPNAEEHETRSTRKACSVCRSGGSLIALRLPHEDKTQSFNGFCNLQATMRGCMLPKNRVGGVGSPDVSGSLSFSPGRKIFGQDWEARLQDWEGRFQDWEGRVQNRVARPQDWEARFQDCGRPDFKSLEILGGLISILEGLNSRLQGLVSRMAKPDFKTGRPGRPGRAYFKTWGGECPDIKTARPETGRPNVKTGCRFHDKGGLHDQRAGLSRLGARCQNWEFRLQDWQSRFQDWVARFQNWGTRLED